MDGALVANLRAFSQLEPTWRQRITAKPGKDEWPRVEFGGIASGAQVIESVDTDLCRAILASDPDIVAVDMEAHGVAFAASAARETKPVGLMVVRCVSDMPLGVLPVSTSGETSSAPGSQWQRRAMWTPYAAKAAAAFLYEFVSSHFPFGANELRAVAATARDLETYDRTTGDVSAGTAASTVKLLNVPASPQLFLGRAADIQTFRRLIHADGSLDEPPVVVSVVGLPGVGKTTFISAIPHDKRIQAAYPDGILWIALGQTRSSELILTVLSTMADWAFDWNGQEDPTAQTLPQALKLSRKRLSRRRVLLVIDDVWDPAVPIAFELTKMVGEGSAAVVTSRTPAVAERIVAEPNKRYVLDVLTPLDSALLLSRLAPDAVARYPEKCMQLVEQVGCLPLALVVAGGLLGSEEGRSLGIQRLVAELAGGDGLLSRDAPANVQPLLHETSLTVAALLQRSVRAMPEDQQRRFAAFGVFAPKPATIDLRSLAAAWQADPDTARRHAATMVAHGVLQLTMDDEYQIHAILQLLAKQMLQRG